jgi:aminoglycoside/choline kinase family phosphotransferase
MNLKQFVQAYIHDTYMDAEKFSWRRLPADGSKRVFYRLSNNKDSFILMANPPQTESNAGKENNSYLRIGKHLFSKGIPVARIYRYNLEQGWFIMEDLGKQSLQEIALKKNNRIDIYERVIELLIRMQLDGKQDFNSAWCYHTPSYDRVIMEQFESNYFLTYFLQGFHNIKQDFSALRTTFTYLSYQASLADKHFFLHRDFQSRNLIIKGDAIGIIDWQGGRFGPLQYDLASLLIDPYVELKKEETMTLYDYYITLLEKSLPNISGSFSRYYPYIAIQRNLQILGAFSYLSKIQGKNGFSVYISPALLSLEGLLKEIDEPELNPLRKIVEKLHC